MELLNRQEVPRFGKVEEVKPVAPQRFHLNNGIPVHFMRSSSTEVLKVEFVFPAGEKYGKHPLLAKVTNALLKNGTPTRSAKQIAEGIDQYGAFLETNVSKDHASVAIYSLAKHLDGVVEIVVDLLLNASYPEEEVKIHLENGKQKMLVNQEKVGFLARKRFATLLFGAQHPYGIQAELSDFNNLMQSDVVDFRKKHYALSTCVVYAVGSDENQLVNALNKQLGNVEFESNASAAAIAKTPFEAQVGRHAIGKKGALQTAIRMGKPMVDKSHADYHGLTVLNTILGGYFGSRLMANIREDKGYTYGINSGLVTLQEGGYFVLATEVGSDVAEASILEIYKEIERLQNEEVGKEELELVKNYRLGSLLRSMDGAFSQMEKYQAVQIHGLDFSYYQRQLAVVESITPVDVLNLAKQYMQVNEFVELRVGEEK
jgi:zinc protease